MSGYYESAGLVTSPQPTSEKEDYAYDTSGRVQNAAFCQSPQSGHTPGSGQLWYSSSEEPASRAREFFDFDPAKRCLNLLYYWETFAATSTSPVTNTDITGWNYTYENTGHARGVKLTASLYNWNAPGSTWTLDHTEDYAYENQRSFLTGAQYNDGQPGASPTWSYDSAQNRTDSVTNDLNQTGYYQLNTWIPTTDPAGRTTIRGAGNLYWDVVSRLTSYTNSGVTDTYEYRADGMRDHRYVAGSSPVNWSYYHDGQTSMEDEQIAGSNLTVTRYGLGARGIDECEQQTGTVSNGVHNLNSSTSVWYPIFDGHGNQCGTISRAVNNSFTQANTRTFDCWGNVRRGATTGAPASRYCGSIGHSQDDESSLIYMRARYCDPSSGRFLSEDTKRSCINYFTYCNNEPMSSLDSAGDFPQLLDEYLALEVFLNDIESAQDGAQVENLWGQMMQAFNPSNSSTLFKLFMQANNLNKLFQGVGVELRQALAAGPLGFELGMICVGYETREEWYVHDIDNG